VDGFLLVFDLEGTLVERVPDLGARHRRRAALNSPGLDWTRKYPAIAAGVASLGARPAHLDGELCSFLPDGITSSGLIQTVADAIDPAGLEYFIFEPAASRWRRSLPAAADRAQGAARGAATALSDGAMPRAPMAAARPKSNSLSCGIWTGRTPTLRSQSPACGFSPSGQTPS